MAIVFFECALFLAARPLSPLSLALPLTLAKTASLSLDARRHLEQRHQPGRRRLADLRRRSLGAVDEGAEARQALELLEVLVLATLWM